MGRISISKAMGGKKRAWQVGMASGALLVWVFVSSGCGHKPALPAVDSTQYRDFCAAFYVGLAALESGEDVHARQGLETATRLVPDEPASWVDLGILQVRQQQFDAAFASVEKARALAPSLSRIEFLLGLIEGQRGKPTEAQAHYLKAVSLDGGNLKALDSLAAETERAGGPASDQKSEEYLKQILATQPHNLAVMLDTARLAAKNGDQAYLKQLVSELRALSTDWPDPGKTQLARVEQQLSTGSIRTAAVPIQFLRNVLLRVPSYRQSLDQVKTSTTVVAEPFRKFVYLPSPKSEPSTPDSGLTFEVRQLAGVTAKGVEWVGAFPLDAESNPLLVWADGTAVHAGKDVALPLPGSQRAAGILAKNAVVAADLNYDFKTDLAIATAGGLKVYNQTEARHFKDSTKDLKLPPAILAGSYTGVWTFDVDLDGDLDLLLGLPHGEPLVLRNNGDGTFLPIHPFHGVGGLTKFVAADFDDDGDPDAVLIDGAGNLIVFENKRLGEYRKLEVPAALAPHNVDLGAADTNGDGRLDIVLLRDNLSIVSLSRRADEAAWASAELVAASTQKPSQAASAANLVIGDLDNNGASDFIVNGQVFLGDGHAFVLQKARLNQSTQALADLDGQGQLDALGLTTGADRGAEAQRAATQGTRNYGWQNIRTKAAQVSGDQRMNSFGIGGEIEIRSELLTQKASIDSSMLHFGLGDHGGTAFARIQWPNGLVQTEFDLKKNQTLRADQRLKGSCPFLFTWNGNKIQFVKDVSPMAGALGAHDGLGHFAPIVQTKEWFKIAGDQLQPRDGIYDLRLTDEYWETYYMDHYELASVDHPPGTQVFVDERVADPPVPSQIYVTREPHPFQAATDERGRDVKPVVQSVDGEYLNSFRLGAYQGVAQDHWVTLELPPGAALNKPTYLIADGWLHPWDDSILVAVNQGSQEKPKDLSIEVVDSRGHWHVAKENLGIPAGRMKTIVLDLSKIIPPGAPHKIRLRTNLEVYWDRLAWAEGLDRSEAVTTQLPLMQASLLYRGFSEMQHANHLVPEVPIYERLASTLGEWRSIEGYYTRYGDVLPLLNETDDRFVIAGSGDELRLSFKAAQPAKPGWLRDYAFVGNGWMKEGDTSFKNSATVLPLPSHLMKRYTGTASELEQDPTYRQHEADWQNYHTRYVTPRSYLAELWSRH